MLRARQCAARSCIRRNSLRAPRREQYQIARGHHTAENHGLTLMAPALNDLSARTSAMSVGEAVGGVAAELRARHGHSNAPESVALLAALAGLVEAAAERGLDPSNPVTLFAAAMGTLEASPASRESPQVRPSAAHCARAMRPPPAAGGGRRLVEANALPRATLRHHRAAPATATRCWVRCWRSCRRRWGACPPRCCAPRLRAQRACCARLWAERANRCAAVPRSCARGGELACPGPCCARRSLDRGETSPRHCSPHVPAPPTPPPPPARTGARAQGRSRVPRHAAGRCGTRSVGRRGCTRLAAAAGLRHRRAAKGASGCARCGAPSGCAPLQRCKPAAPCRSAPTPSVAHGPVTLPHHATLLTLKGAAPRSRGGSGGDGSGASQAAASGAAERRPGTA